MWAAETIISSRRTTQLDSGPPLAGSCQPLSDDSLAPLAPQKSGVGSRWRPQT
jgi:hypothetical protein